MRKSIPPGSWCDVHDAAGFSEGWMIVADYSDNGASRSVWTVAVYRRFYFSVIDHKIDDQIPFLNFPVFSVHLFRSIL
jgi:hypothetical protein